MIAVCLRREACQALPLGIIVISGFDDYRPRDMELRIESVTAIISRERQAWPGVPSVRFLPLSHVRLHKVQASEFVASLEAFLSGSAGHGRGRGRRDDG